MVRRSVAPRDYGGVTHGVVGLQCRLNFSELNPKTANLDLVVAPPEKLDISVFMKTAEIARLVQQSSWAEWIRDEVFGGQFRPVEISSRQTITGHMNFTGHADRNGVEARIQQVDTNVRDRFADRNEASRAI